jgi:hypothetical protein
MLLAHRIKEDMTRSFKIFEAVPEEQQVRICLSTCIWMPFPFLSVCGSLIDADGCMRQHYPEPGKPTTPYFL